VLDSRRLSARPPPPPSKRTSAPPPTRASHALPPFRLELAARRMAAGTDPDADESDLPPAVPCEPPDCAEAPPPCEPWGAPEDADGVMPLPNSGGLPESPPPGGPPMPPLPVDPPPPAVSRRAAGTGSSYSCPAGDPESKWTPGWPLPCCCPDPDAEATGDAQSASAPTIPISTARPVISIRKSSGSGSARARKGPGRIRGQRREGRVIGDKSMRMAVERLCGPEVPQSDLKVT